MKIAVVIPAYNEEPVIGSVLDLLKKELEKTDHEIIVVDDGSRDNTGKIASQHQATVLTHPINRGLGGALGTGFAYAKQTGTDILVTMDADGQHDPHEINKLIQPLKAQKADVVIGSRMLAGFYQMPLDRRIIIKAGNLLTGLLFSVKTTDSQSGFRAFSQKAIKLLSFKTQGMEAATELFSEIKNYNLILKEVPIKVIYTEYSRNKGQSNLNALSILVRLLLRLAR